MLVNGSVSELGERGGKSASWDEADSVKRLKVKERPRKGIEKDEGMSGQM